MASRSKDRLAQGDLATPSRSFVCSSVSANGAVITDPVKIKPLPFSATIDMLPDPVLCVATASMTIIEVNRAACDSLGYQAEELIGLSLAQICPAADIALLKQRCLLNGDTSPIIQTRHRRKDGRQLDVEWHLSQYVVSGQNYWIIIAREQSETSATELFNTHANVSPDGLGVVGHDPLTGLPDRRLFERKLDTAIDLARSDRTYQFALCFIDLDNFKAINDRIGHLAGDQVLCEVARRLIGCVRPGDMVARFGGDEFTVLVDNLHSPADAGLVAQRIVEQLKQPIHIDQQAVSLDGSVGVATNNQNYRTANDLLRAADRAMYRAKALGGGRIMLFSSELSPYPQKPR